MDLQVLPLSDLDGTCWHTAQHRRRRYRLCNLAASGSRPDFWTLSERELSDSYTMTEHTIKDNWLTGGTQGGDQLLQAAQTLLDGAGVLHLKPDELATVQRELIFERSHQRCEHQQWRFAMPCNLAVAVELTSELLGKCLQEWLKTSLSELQPEHDFAVPWTNPTPSDVFYREESWGGTANAGVQLGVQPFQLGDMLIGDVQPENVHRLGSESSQVWKQTATRDFITRTMASDIFSRTYQPHTVRKKSMGLSRQRSDTEPVVFGGLRRRTSNTSTDGGGALALMRNDSVGSMMSGCDSAGGYGSVVHPLAAEKRLRATSLNQLCNECAKAKRVSQMALKHRDSASSGECCHSASL